MSEPPRGTQSGHLLKLLTATLGRGRQNLMLQLAESPARRAEPVWRELLQALGPWGLQAPWLNMGTLEGCYIQPRVGDQASGPLESGQLVH